MKKRIIALALCVCTAFSVAACGKKDDNKETTAAAEEKTVAKLTLGDYKGIKVDASLKTVEDSKVDEYLQSVLKGFSTTEEVKEGELEKDGQAKISYKSTVDGKEYKNAEGTTLNLTDKGFDVDGFVDGLIGKKVGETVELDLKLAEDFSDEEVKGKDIHFTVFIEAKINTIVPEFTDEFVKEHFDYLGLNVKQELLDYLKNELVLNQVYSEIWQEVVDNANAESYDSDALNDMAKKYAEYQEYMIYSYTGADLKTYLASVGKSEDDFMKEMKEAAKPFVKQEMVIDAIAKAENIQVSDELYNSKMLEFAKSYGYETVAEFEEANKDSMTKDDFVKEILTYEVQDFVCKNVEYVEGFGLRSDKETTGAETTSSAAEETTGE